MSEKERLNEVILEEENNGGGTKKVFLIVAIAIIILAVLLMVFWKSTRVAPKETFLQTDSGMQKIGNTKDEKKDDEFESLNLDPSKQEDKLDKVADNVKKQENDAFNMPTQTDQTQTEMKTAEETQEAKKELKAVEHTSTQKESQAATKKETPHKKPKATPKDKEAHKTKHVAKEPKVKKEAHKEVPKKANSKTNLTKGHYLQVGVFVHTPNKAFLQAFNQFPHKIEDRGATKRYLIGPYKSKQEALMHTDEVSKKMTKPVVIEAR
ncbi:SPOR domain-containing protein [Helicobacter pylori]|uniref:SPOR domain-containing protein n=1 Tax=Helicobacter pylori TaxID=210 RepID=UPI00112DDE87|nr:SPOR domain-containing protein [Helicobacter pylori]TPH61965.1 SPOR domain-containing protein [Helicobacter pylori]TPH63086.1 SPOR domain-containing protein [Helicobacter pylori]TPH66851.1 SPOR domain-containing protein [Helicobacter pylori]TPH68569.1 SPOR domain-containing protein [Helicobacter pylori]